MSPVSGSHSRACVEGAPAAYFSTLPLREILAALTAEGIPAAISNTAGTYLCNDTLYTTLDALARRGRSIPAGFIHLPNEPSIVTAHGVVATPTNEKTAMPLLGPARTPGQA